MNYKDKLLMVIIYNDLIKKIKKIEEVLRKNVDNAKMDDFEIEKLSEDEIQEKLVEGELALKKSVLVMYFSTNFDYGTDCLIAPIFFTINVPLFKKYTSEKIENIDINRSNYFWDSLSMSNIDIKDPGYELLNIYNAYKIMCDELPIDGLYDMVEDLIDTICLKYNDYMGLKENGLNIKNEITKNNNEKIENEKEEERKIKEENRKMSTKNITIPGLLFGFFAILMFEDYNFIYFVITIISFIWLCVGISSKSNSCKKCGKWNSYELIEEEVLDSYVTTENQTEYRNGQPYTYPATVTQEKILQTHKCKNCGNIKYIETERNK